jgi:hypothetical protein
MSQHHDELYLRHMRAACDRLTRVWHIARDAVPALHHAVDHALRGQDAEWDR